MSTLSIEDIFNFGFHPDVVMNTVPAGFCDQPPSGGSRSLKPARLAKARQGIATRWSLNTMRCYIQPLALAAALALATSNPLTEAGRKTQRALYFVCKTWFYFLLYCIGKF